jgi:hypothetical protein
MAQAPATPKAKRLVLRLAAAASPGLAARLGPVPSEVAAIAARTRPLARPPDPTVVFLVPLVGRHHVGDWTAVSARLAATVESFRRQTSPAWQALICGQDRPDGLPEDARVSFLPFDATGTGNDKWRKLAALAQALPEAGTTQGYAMPFDADDLLAPGAVAEMVGRRARGGYLVTQGYLRDEGTGLLAEARPRSFAAPRQKAFWKLCGSCAAFAFDFREGVDDAGLIGAIAGHEHRMFPYLARLAGRSLAPLSPGAVLYLLNHGENFGARRGRISFKRRFVQRFALTDPDRIARVEAAFHGRLA